MSNSKAPTWFRGVCFTTSEQAVKFAQECYRARLKRAFPAADKIIVKEAHIKTNVDKSNLVGLEFIVHKEGKRIPIVASITIQHGADWFISQATPWVVDDL